MIAAVALLLPGAQHALAQSEIGFGSGSIGNAIESAQEDRVEEQVEEQVTEQIVDQVTEQVLEVGFGSGGRLDEIIDEQVEEQVEDSVTDAVEELIENTAVEKVDNTVAENIEESIEESVTESVEEDITASVEADVTASVEANVEQVIEETVEQSVATGVTDNVETVVEQQVALATTDNLDDSLEGAIDDIIETIESDLEVSEDRIHKGQWLVMAEPEVFAELADEGYLFDHITELPGMGMWLADVAAPSSFDITAARQGVVDVVGSDRAEVDLNHIYTAGTTVASTGAGVAPRAALAIPVDTEQLSLRLGMIDSEVDLLHPALANSHLHTRSFTPEGASRPDFHGTAIASILAAQSEDYMGLAPNAELYAASVFEEDEERGEVASTLSLIKALDWLISSQVDVVNISLAGPPNRLLEAALKRIVGMDVVVLAAAGNGGPAAGPMYPAAYDSVVAVTAVDGNQRVFRLANRGNYLDLAAPGVNLLHARAGGGYASSSGTSFAVPFATTAAARLIKLHPGDNAVAQLFASAQDLGPVGRDDIYGYGLLQLTPR